jgi:hypothetical protein
MPAQVGAAGCRTCAGDPSPQDRPADRPTLSLPGGVGAVRGVFLSVVDGTIDPVKLDFWFLGQPRAGRYVAWARHRIRFACLGRVGWRV